MKLKFRSFVRLIFITAIAMMCLQTSTLLRRTTAVTTGSGFTVSELAWISGGWQTAAGGRAQIEEHWMAPSGNSMIGMGRTVAGGRTVEFEYLRIEERDGQVYYVASPKGRCPGTDFKLTRLAAQEAVFENPENDFPKRITYRKNSDGSL